MNFVIKPWGPVETSTFFRANPLLDVGVLLRVDGFCYVGLIFPSNNPSLDTTPQQLKS